MLASPSDAFICIAKNLGDLLYAIAILAALLLATKGLLFYIAIVFMIIVIIAIIANCITLGTTKAPGKMCRWRYV